MTKTAIGCLIIISLFCMSTKSVHAVYTTDFDSFTTGSLSGQDGWSSAFFAGMDQEIVDLGGGNKALRLSNSVISTGFGNQPISPRSGDIAGESTSTHIPSGDLPTSTKYYASFDFRSVTGAAQTGLDITISPDDGTGSRQGFISIEDNGAGIEIDFVDSGVAGDFSGGTTPATGLSYTDWHTVAFEIEFVDGISGSVGTEVGNDIVKLYVDGGLVDSKSTWESYFMYDPPAKRAIDSLLFRISTGPVPSVDGGGFYFDNIYIGELAPVAQTAVAPEPSTIALAVIGVLAIMKRRRSS